ncbi:uncharacterized protein LOC124541254 [Vanessa cardui]|uniref:uncharacterized protein LOC124541254 n=1 Tax=Vanessa cardui TaxID=171605 RepID=UPI001F13A7DC|nr:uncharacterized protein LOC124541254 [Vanessa cardui]
MLRTLSILVLLGVWTQDSSQYTIPLKSHATQRNGTDDSETLRIQDQKLIPDKDVTAHGDEASVHSNLEDTLSSRAEAEINVSNPVQNKTQPKLKQLENRKSLLDKDFLDDKNKWTIAGSVAKLSNDTSPGLKIKRLISKDRRRSIRNEINDNIFEKNLRKRSNSDKRIQVLLLHPWNNRLFKDKVLLSYKRKKNKKKRKPGRPGGRPTKTPKPTSTTTTESNLHVELHLQYNHEDGETESRETIPLAKYRPRPGYNVEIIPLPYYVK